MIQVRFYIRFHRYTWIGWFSSES